MLQGKVLSVDRLTGPKATGETCDIVIETNGDIPYWEGQSYGVVPPVCSCRPSAFLQRSSWLHINLLRISLPLHPFIGVGSLLGKDSFRNRISQRGETVLLLAVFGPFIPTPGCSAEFGSAPHSCRSWAAVAVPDQSVALAD